MSVEYIGHNGEDGMCVGLASSEKLGFYGATPAAHRGRSSYHRCGFHDLQYLGVFNQHAGQRNRDAGK